MKKKLLSLLFALGIVGTFLSASNLSLGAVLPQAVAVYETSLASRIESTDVSMTLTTNLVKGGTTLSGYNCFTVDQGSPQIEYICGTVSGTSVTSLVRGIDPSTGTSTISTLKFPHRRGASVKITDFPAVVIMRHQLNGSDSIYNLMKYDTNVLCGVGTATSTICPKAYVDSVGSSGASNADETTKGIVELATAREAASSTALGSTVAALALRAAYATDTPQSGCAAGFTSTPGAGCVPVARLDGKISANFIATSSAYNWGGAQTFNTATTTFNATTTVNGVAYIGQFMQLVASTTINSSTGPVPVFIATSTNALIISEADVATTTDFLGFATSTNVSNGATGTVQISGIVNGFSGLTVGQPYYVSNTRGAISSTVGSAELYVGTAVSATQILLDRKDSNWQYLGSGTCTQANVQSTSCDTASVPFARFAIFLSSTNSSLGTSQVTGTVAKVGATVMTNSIQVTSASPAVDVQSHSITFTSTSSVRFVGNHSAGASWTGQTNTAYFFR